jgi:hypothetical protein
MKVTKIGWVRNETSNAIVISNIENPGDTNGGKGTIPARCVVSLPIWIPWCQHWQDFGAHRIDIIIPGEPLFQIWQQDVERGNDTDRGDWVRVTTNGYQNPGVKLGGDAVAGEVDLVLFFGIIQGYSAPELRKKWPGFERT